MKYINIFLLSFALLLTPLLGCGCKNTTPDTVAFKVSREASITVESAMSAWNDWVGLGKASIAEERQVKAAFEKYQASQLLVLDAAIAYNNAQQAVDLPTVTASQARLNAAISGASAALSDLVSLLTKFGAIKQ